MSDYDNEFAREDHRRAGHVSVDEAHQIARGYNASHFRNHEMGEHARYTVPADPLRDDDLRLSRFIAQHKLAMQALKAIAEPGSEGVTVIAREAIAAIEAAPVPRGA